MNISNALDDLKDGFEDALDVLLGTRKAVCPHCGKVIHLVNETNVIAPHVYMIDKDSLDFNDILDCPGSNRIVEVIHPCG